MQLTVLQSHLIDPKPSHLHLVEWSFPNQGLFRHTRLLRFALNEEWSQLSYAIKEI